MVDVAVSAAGSRRPSDDSTFAEFLISRFGDTFGDLFGDCIGRHLLQAADQQEYLLEGGARKLVDWF